MFTSQFLMIGRQCGCLCRAYRITDNGGKSVTLHHTSPFHPPMIIHQHVNCGVKIKQPNWRAKHAALH
jgi:hypothetical protein